MKKICLFGLFVVLVSFLSFSLSFAAVKDPDTITIAWTPNNAGDNQKDLREEFASIIAKATGKKVENKLTTDYNIAMSAIESGDAQLGYFGPWEYLMEHSKDAKIVPVVVESGNSGTLSDAMYHSRFLVKKGNEGQYKSGNSYDIDNIVGKKMSFVSTSSTSGFNMPATAILGKFGKQDKWKDLTKADLTQSGKFFNTVLFGGSHQLSLVNLLSDRAEVAAVDDIDVASYVTLTSGKDNEIGAVYTVNKGADAPFDSLAGAQYFVIKSIPVQNTPFEANSNFLTKKTINAIAKALTSEEVTKNPKIFMVKGTKGSMFVQPHCFVQVKDSWYNPMRKVLGLK